MRSCSDDELSHDRRGRACAGTRHVGRGPPGTVVHVSRAPAWGARGGRLHVVRRHSVVGDGGESARRPGRTTWISVGHHPRTPLSHHGPRAAFCTCTRCSGLCCPTRDPVRTPRCLRLAYTPHVIGAWLGSAHLRRETAPPCGSCGRCLGGYPWAARAGGVLRVGCAASPTAVLASDGGRDVHNTWGARTPRRVASRGCLSPGFPPTPPTRSSRPPPPALTRRPDPTWAPPSPPHSPPPRP